jgi:hypothetical protein
LHTDGPWLSSRAAGIDGSPDLEAHVLDGIETAIMGVLRKASQAYDVTDEFDTFVTLHGEPQEQGA